MAVSEQVEPFCQKRLQLLHVGALRCIVEVQVMSCRCCTSIGIYNDEVFASLQNMAVQKLRCTSSGTLNSVLVQSIVLVQWCPILRSALQNINSLCRVYG